LNTSASHLKSAALRPSIYCCSSTPFLAETPGRGSSFPGSQIPAAEPTFPGKVLALADALEAAKIPWAIGGAIALIYYGTPRATSDIDLNIFIAPSDFGRLEVALEPIGVDVAVSTETLERSGQCRVKWGRTPIDLFMANVEFHAAMERKLRRVPFGGSTIKVISPEHLIICKALFNRAKDWPDIEQIVQMMPDLDAEEVVEWLTAMLGPRDERTTRFVALTRA
jgi:predicted nucleotidyltransferase